MTTHPKQEPLAPSGTDLFQATQVGLANISEQVGELGLSEIQLLMLLAGKRLGSWVPLRQVKTEMPGRSAAKITRVLHKLANQNNSDRLVTARPSSESGREKELRLTSRGQGARSIRYRVFSTTIRRSFRSTADRTLS